MTVKIRLQGVGGKFVVIIADHGNVTADYIGFHGRECEELAETVETRLGIIPEERKRKPEYYEETGVREAI